jgi:hypothetical protein
MAVPTTCCSRGIACGQEMLPVVPLYAADMPVVSHPGAVAEDKIGE